MALSIIQNSRFDGGKPRLTNRETEILSHVSLGRSNKSVAELLFVSTRTIEYHLARSYEKLGARNRVQAILAASSLGLIQDIPGLKNAHRMRDALELELVSVCPEFESQDC